MLRSNARDWYSLKYESFMLRSNKQRKEAKSNKTLLTKSDKMAMKGGMAIMPQLIGSGLPQLNSDMTSSSGVAQAIHAE